MRVIPTACPDTNAALLDAFRHHLADRDLAPATVHAYLSDLTRFQAWLTWVHEDQAPLLTQVRHAAAACVATPRGVRLVPRGRCLASSIGPEKCGPRPAHGPSRVAGGRGDRPYSCGSDP